MKIIDIREQLDGLFLVFLALTGGVGFSLFNCPLQDLLNHNPVVRHLAYFIVILFTATVLEDKAINPIHHLPQAAIIYIFLLLFTKMHVNFTIVVFLLLTTLYIMRKYRQYFKYQVTHTKDPEIKKSYNKYRTLSENLSDILLYSIYALTLIGFSTFALDKYKQHGKKFNIKKFVFGVRKCKK